MTAVTRQASDAALEIHASANSWLGRAAAQQASYASQTKPKRILDALAREAPPIAADAVASLAAQVARAARGEAFVVQLGDCAEAIRDANGDSVRRRIALIDDAAAIVGAALGTRAIKIGRMAGQYAKPRTQLVETREGVTLPSFRGESINGEEFTAASRAPNPLRLRSAYLAARKTHQLVEAHNARRAAEERVYTSHEALQLDFEDALTRHDDRLGRFNALGHLVWIGARTNHPEHAHVLYGAALANPVAVKVSPTTTPDEIRQIHARLNPRNLPGRSIFISRMGAGKVDAHLPSLVRALDDAGAHALWMCDPMHGNTFAAPSGVKTRALAEIRADLSQTIDALAREGHALGGVHLEASPDDIAECVSSRDRHDELSSRPGRFRSKCDPRLNRGQLLDLCHWLAAKLAATKGTT